MELSAIKQKFWVTLLADKYLSEGNMFLNKEKPGSPIWKVTLKTLNVLEDGSCLIYIGLGYQYLVLTMTLKTPSIFPKKKHPLFESIQDILPQLMGFIDRISTKYLYYLCKYNNIYINTNNIYIKNKDIYSVDILLGLKIKDLRDIVFFLAFFL